MTVAVSLLLALAGCGGGASSVPPAVPHDRPFEPLAQSDVQAMGAAGSNIGPGLSASATPIRNVVTDVDGTGHLRVRWQSGADLRIRTWDGSVWTDERVSLKAPGGERVRPWEYAVGPGGLTGIGVDLPGVDRIEPPELTISADGSERAHTGVVDGVWASDPEGRLVFTHFAGPRVEVRRRATDSWQVLGENLSARGFRAGERQGPAVAFDAQSHPVVAWRQPYEVLPDRTSNDRYKSNRWRTLVKRWSGDAWTTLSGDDTPLDEDPRLRYPQAKPGTDKNRRAEWEAAQQVPASVAVTSGGDVVVAWDTLDGLEVWRHDGVAWAEMPDPVDLEGTAEHADLIAWGDGVAISWAHAWREPKAKHTRQIQVRTWDGERWSSPGGVHASGASGTHGPSMAPRLVSWKDQLVVSWTDVTSGSQELLLAVFDGEKWTGLPAGSRTGGHGNPDLPSSIPEVDLGADSVTVAWVEELEPGIPPGPSELHAASWSGGAWTERPALKVPSRPFQISLRSSADHTYALWDQRTGKGARGLFVAELTTEAWSPVRGAGKGGSLIRDAVGAYDAALAVDASGAPWVAWAHNGRSAQVRRRVGDKWVVVGAVPGDSVVGRRPDLEIGAKGRPWLLWFGQSSNRDVDVKLGWFDGSSWQQVGETWWLACDGNIGGPPPVQAELALDDQERPLVAWLSVPRERRKNPAAATLHVRRWDGNRWTALPNPVSSPTIAVADARRAHFALTTEDGPTVAWSQVDAGGRQIHAARWDGASWVPLGTRRGVVSDCDGACWTPSLAVSPQSGASAAPARRCVAWEEMAAQGRNISVRCQQ